MQLHPLYSQLLIEPHSNGSVTKGGLLVPDIAKNKSPFRYGTIHAAGTGRTNAEGVTIPLVCKAGDTVLYARGAGLEVPIEDERGERIMLLLEERFILAIVTGLPQQTSITGLDGRLLSMHPGSLALDDRAYANRENADIAVRAGWAEPDDFEDDDVPFEPKN